MKLKNFEYLGRVGDGDFATVEVESGIFFWKKTIRKEICKINGGYWFFVESGKFTPDRDAETLEKAFFAKKALKNLEKGE